MATIQERLRWLAEWCSDPTNRNWKAARHMAAKAKTFPFGITKHGISPLKDEYLVRYIVIGKHPFRGVVSGHIIERVDGEANPRLLFDKQSTSGYSGDSTTIPYAVIKPHALDRYAERHLKKPKGYSMTVEEISEMLFSKDSMVMSTDSITGEVQLKIDAGLFLGEKQKDGGITINTFVADHNLFPNQSMEKRNMNDYQGNMDAAYNQILSTKKGFNMIRGLADHPKQLTISTLSSTPKH